MAPVAYGMLAKIAGIIFLAVLVGAAGGAINGRLKGELSLGVILVAGTYVVAVMSLESWSSWKLSVFGMFPLTLTFLVGSSTHHVLETRVGLRPVFATVTALGTALLAGLVYMMLIRLRWLALVNPSTAWIAVATLSCLIIVSIRTRMRALRSPGSARWPC